MAALPEVLVVEDDSSLQSLMSISLRRERLSVTTANDGGQGIEQLRKRHFRVVLLDLMMPRVNGWEVIDWLKKHPESRPYSLIVTTAADRLVFSQLDPEVVNAVLVKPFDIYELAGYVLRCCQNPSKRDRRSRRIVGRA